jgi:hypothetical protein
MNFYLHKNDFDIDFVSLNNTLIDTFKDNDKSELFFISSFHNIRYY